MVKKGASDERAFLDGSPVGWDSHRRPLYFAYRSQQCRGETIYFESIEPVSVVAFQNMTFSGDIAPDGAAHRNGAS
jgi:hypothetical protein